MEPDAPELPAADSSAAPRYALYSPQQVSLAALLGTPAAGLFQIVYYDKGATRAEATKLGEYLKTSAFFDDQNGKDVQLTAEGGVYALSFVLTKGFNDAEISLGFGLIRTRIEADVFPGKTVVIKLCNEAMKVQRTIGVGDKAP